MSTKDTSATIEVEQPGTVEGGHALVSTPKTREKVKETLERLRNE